MTYRSIICDTDSTDCCNWNEIQLMLVDSNSFLMRLIMTAGRVSFCHKC